MNAQTEKPFTQKHSNPELSDEERDSIRALFFQEVVPKLIKLQARLGTISCEFADPKYSNWMIRFRSRGSDFELVDFEYDEDAASIDLDL
jgi:hypothetical protein